MGSIGRSLNSAGSGTKPCPLYEETLPASKAKLGPEHPHTLAVMNNLAEAYRLRRAVERSPRHCLEETLRLVKAKLGPDHPNTWTVMFNLAAIYRGCWSI